MKNRYKDYRIAFGKNVKELREKRKLKPHQLAVLANVETAQIYRVENAEHSTTHDIIIAIAVALGKTPAELHNIDFVLPLNKNFSTPEKKNSAYSKVIKKLIDETDFFQSYREVIEIRNECKRLYGVILDSTPTSIALKNFVEKGVLKRKTSPKKKSHYVYTSKI